MISFFEKIGTIFISKSLAFFETTGKMFLMLVHALSYTFTSPIRLRNIFKEMEFVGVQSIFIVVLTGSFTGMVLAMQSYYGLSKFGAESLVGPTVALSMARELGPVLTGLMVTGRAGSAMATELGTMRVTEQIDAIKIMGLNPVKFLITPKILAGIFMLPLLAILTDFIGMIGGYLVGVKHLGINGGIYIQRTIEFVEFSDIFNGLIKSVIFGMIISLNACYFGFYAEGGAQGVGRSATNAVVTSSIMILISDYILTSLMF